MRNPYYIIASFALLVAFSACGDDSSTASVPNGVDRQASTMEDLLNCTENRAGETVFVTEQNSAYICTDGEWIDFVPTMDDLLNCTMNRESKTVYVNEHNFAYVCMDEKWYPQKDVPYIKEKSSSSVKLSSSDARFSSSIVTPTSSSSVTPKSSSSETSVFSSSMTKTDGSEYDADHNTLTDFRDSKTYKTVKIGNQTWMAENLNYNASGSSCYNSLQSNCDTYGRMYSQESAKKACPEGWHLPSSTEWKTLLNNVSPSSSLLAKNYSLGFRALLAGSSANAPGTYAIFWTSNAGESANIGTSYNGVYSIIPGELIYVRCLKDEGPTTQSNSNEAKFSSSSVTPQSSSSKKVESSSSKVAEPAEVTSGTMTDSRDKRTYKTVTIGTQTWMAENLNYKTANSYCYDDNASNCTKYGRLYTWAAAMDSVGTWSTNGNGCGYNKTCSPTYPVRGVCPEGWHLPTKSEFETLFTAVGGLSTAGKVLKSTSGWNSSGNGSDAFAFSALSAGFRVNGSYFNEGNDASFWSSTEYNSGFAECLTLFYDEDGAGSFNSTKDYGLSVRCLKD